MEDARFVFYKSYFCCSVEERWDRDENWRQETLSLTDKMVPLIKKWLMIPFIKMGIPRGKARCVRH